MIKRIPRRVAVAFTIMTIALGIPLGVAFASHQFSDVPNSNIFHDDIAAIAASGVTTGCGGTRYCPADFVTREQMAAFMNRLGALAPNKVPVVNADKVDGLDAASLGRAAFATADDNAFVGTTGSSGTVLSTSIDVPVKGHLIISASSDVFNGVEDDTSIICSVSVGGTQLAHSRREISLALAGNREEDCSTNGVFTALAAGSHSVTFNATGVSTNTVFDESTLAVQFVPFGSTGILPASVLGEGSSGGTETNGE